MRESVYTAGQLARAIELAEKAVEGHEYDLAQARAWLAWLKTQTPSSPAAANRA